MRLLSLGLGTFLVTAACGGAQPNPLDDGGATADGGDAQSTTDAPSGKDGAAADVIVPPKDGGACPIESGGYTIQLTGAGCGDTSTSVNECIQQSACTITLDFGGGSGKGLKGTTPIQSDGSFSNAAIEEGSSQRSGCTGTWTEATSTLVIDCGGVNTTQSCIATLVRTSATCI
jgi:hypothetical protein